MLHSQLILATIEDDGVFADTGPNPATVIGSRLWHQLDVLNHPGTLSDILTRIGFIWAAIFLVVGGLCILNGYRWHKFVILILAALSGIWIGAAMGDRLGNPYVIASCLSILFAVVAWPFMKYAVAIFGGLAGAFAGANVWTALGFAPSMHQMGAVIGLITVGMLTFLAFRSVVILLTVVGGATLLVFGGMSALMNVPAFESGIESGMSRNPLMVPVIVGSAAVIGAVIQSVGGWNGLKQSADRAESSSGAVPRRKAA